jgi:hypothetical protein
MATLQDKWDEFTDKLQEQQIVQQFQNSFQQLSPEQQQYTKWGSLLAVIGVVFYFTWGVISSANEVKGEYFENQELLHLVNSASDEIRRLKGQNAGLAPAGSQNWKTVFQNLATGQGLPADSAEVTKETPGPVKNVIQETLLDVHLKNLTIRPLVQMLFQVEHGSPPMKLKGIQINTVGSDGQLEAKLVLSGFLPKAEKKP